jgi:hypothetical protein
VGGYRKPPSILGLFAWRAVQAISPLDGGVTEGLIQMDDFVAAATVRR